jgi:hypothetical protein
MVRKGYVEQQLEGLALVLARLLALRQRPDDAGSVLEEIHKGAKSLTGLDLAHLVELPEPMFLSLFQNGTVLDAGKAVIIGTLFMEEAEERERTGGDDGRNALRRARAETLLGAALAQEPVLRTSETMTRLLALKRRQQASGNG